MKHNAINSRAQELNSNNKVRQLGTRTRGSIISYFDGQDLTGKIHRNSNTYAAFIAVVTDSGATGFRKRRHKSPDVLRQELGNALKSAGFVNSEGELSIPGRERYDEIPPSIGPIMPAILAILEIEHGIDSSEAVRQYRPDSLEIIRPEENQEPVNEDTPEKDWGELIRNSRGFDPSGEAFVYVLELNRISDSSTWFYVGKSEGRWEELESRIRSHANKFTQSRVISFEGNEILAGDYDTSVPPQGITHHVVDVERIVSISGPDLAGLEDSALKSKFISEVERRTSYEVAIDHDSTKVLGGK